MSVSSVDCLFLFKLKSSWFLVWGVIFYQNLNVLDIMLWHCILFNSYSFQASFGITLMWERGCHLIIARWGDRNLGSSLSMGREELPVTAGWGWKLSLPPRYFLYHSGWENKGFFITALTWPPLAWRWEGVWGVASLLLSGSENPGSPSKVHGSPPQWVGEDCLSFIPQWWYSPCPWCGLHYHCCGDGLITAEQNARSWPLSRPLFDTTMLGGGGLLHYPLARSQG